MDDFELRFLTKEEIYVNQYDEDETTALDVLQKYCTGVAARNTDFSCLTGGLRSGSSAFYYLESNYSNGRFYFMGDYANYNSCDQYQLIESYKGHLPIRPVLYFPNRKVSKENLNFDWEQKIYWWEYGEYPQFVLDENNQLERNIIEVLNQKLCMQSLDKTGKTYCFYQSKKNTPCSINYVSEYVYEGKKYIPLVANGIKTGALLSTGEKIVDFKLYWLKVEPIVWLYDEEKDLFISEHALVSGPSFDFVKEGNGFEATEMYEYIHNHLKKDIIPSQIIEKDKSSVLDSSEPLKKYVYKNYGRRG